MSTPPPPVRTCVLNPCLVAPATGRFTTPMTGVVSHHWGQVVSVVRPQGGHADQLHVVHVLRKGLPDYDGGLGRYWPHSFLLPPPYILYLVCIYIGWVGVDWRRRCRTRLSLRELDSQGPVFVFRRLPRMTVKLDHFCAGRT